MTTPQQTLKDAYAASAPPDHITQSLAASFRTDEQMEALAQLRHSDPAAYDAMRPGMHMQLGQYEQAKAAAHAQAAPSVPPAAPPAGVPDLAYFYDQAQAAQPYLGGTAQ